MKVFISWSGPTSKAVAELLRQYLPVMINRVEPWLSSEDIDKGARWHHELATQLQDTQVGVLCLTAPNLSAPWLLFEAGALSKSLAQGRVCPYLIGVEPTEITGPLTQFQASRANQVDSRRLVSTINQALPQGEALDDHQLDLAFDLAWPKLESGIASALATSSAVTQSPQRADRDLLEEILSLVRTQAAEAALARLASELLAALRQYPTRRTTPGSSHSILLSELEKMCAGRPTDDEWQALVRAWLNVPSSELALHRFVESSSRQPTAEPTEVTDTAAGGAPAHRIIP